MINCIKHIYTTENGAQAFYRGFSAQAFRSTIGTAFMFFSYEIARATLKKYAE